MIESLYITNLRKQEREALLQWRIRTALVLMTVVAIGGWATAFTIILMTK